MSDEIELHDSWVEVSMVGSVLAIRFCPAYVHHWDRLDGNWVGEGRSQQVEMLIADGSITSGLVSGRAELSDGGFEVDENSYDDMIPVPLEKRGVVHGKLEFVNGLVVEFTGCGMSTRLSGPPEFIEKLPSDWAPNENGCLVTK